VPNTEFAVTSIPLPFPNLDARDGGRGTSRVPGAVPMAGGIVEGVHS